MLCLFGLPGVIVSNHRTQFAILSVIEFCKGLGKHNRFILMEHPRVNDQAEAENTIILSDMRKKLDGAKGLWVKYMHEIL